jgi:hypothetical protein
MSSTTSSTSTSGKVISSNFKNSALDIFPNTGIFLITYGGNPFSSTVTSTITTLTLLNVSFQYINTDTITTTTTIYATIVRSTDPLFASGVTTNLATGSQTALLDQNNSLWSSTVTNGQQVTCSMVYYDVNPPYSRTYYYGIQINNQVNVGAGIGTVNSATIIVTGSYQ